MMRPVSASAHLEQPPERVFEFLADLRNHWRLTQRLAALETLDGDGAGGRVRIGGPLGLSRVARTRVVGMDPPRALHGQAHVGRRTVGLVHWRIEPNGQGSHVTLSAVVERATRLDRLILAVGGRRLLARAFADAVAQLGRVA